MYHVKELSAANKTNMTKIFSSGTPLQIKAELGKTTIRLLRPI